MRLSLAAALVALPTVLVASHGWAGTPSKEAARFERLKGLAGRWESADADKDGKPDQVATYRVTSGGTCVEETLVPGKEPEMVTMYTLDGDALVMTHYCSLGSQPHMQAKAQVQADAIEFTFVSAGNLKDRAELHMDALTLTLTDATHLRHAWQLVKDGKTIATAAFAFTKVP